MSSQNWQTQVEQTVTGLGYALVELERSAGGLLRIFIELPNGVPAITVDDCEKVTRQLQYVLEVQQTDYQRLEVSSPGLDRPLKSAQDFERFMGERIEVTFKQSIEIPAPESKPGSKSEEKSSVKPSKAYKQKKFTGRLDTAAPEQTDGWLLVLEPELEMSKDRKNAVRKKVQAVLPEIGLGFTLDEIREARLAPVVSFKGHKTIVNPQGSTDTDLAADEPFNENGDPDR